MTEPATPAELKAIAEECSEFETDYRTGLQMTFAVGGEGYRRCDFCIHWQGGLCDIYLDEIKEE
ncbi:MAG: hypothetical protein ACOX18_05245 [Bacillota bacterium]|jgi:hypothetical protein